MTNDTFEAEEVLLEEELRSIGTYPRSILEDDISSFENEQTRRYDHSVDQLLAAA